MTSLSKSGSFQSEENNIIPKLPRYLLWQNKASLRKLMDTPFPKIIYMLLKEVTEKEGIKHIPLIAILNEAYYQCIKIVFENKPKPDIEAIEIDIKANLKVRYHSKLVFIAMYAILVSRKDNSKEVEAFMRKLEVFNALLENNKIYLNYINKVRRSYNKIRIDLSPEPCPVEALSSYPIIWKDITNNFDSQTLNVVVCLWKNPIDRDAVKKLICNEIHKEISESQKQERKVTRLESRQRVFNKTARDKTAADNMSLLDCSNKELERSFSLKMILDYCLQHTTKTTGPVIIGMLNKFLRDSGNSTEEERLKVDEVEHKILHPYIVGNVYNNPLFNVKDAHFDGPMYDVTGNSNVNIGGQKNGEEE